MHEFLIVQNHALGALAIQSFTKEFYKHTGNRHGPTLPLIMPLLPIVFNEKSSKCFAKIKRITQERFLNTLSDHRDLSVGLQSRMVNMSEQTFKSLNLAFSLNLVAYQPLSGEIIPVKYLKKQPKLIYGDNQEIIQAARVVGNWFASYTIEQICISLNIVF
ncbi:MAG: three component ABC system middle component [Ginsengibacter sp.]